MDNRSHEQYGRQFSTDLLRMHGFQPSEQPDFVAAALVRQSFHLRRAAQAHGELLRVDAASQSRTRDTLAAAWRCPGLGMTSQCEIWGRKLISGLFKAVATGLGFQVESPSLAEAGGNGVPLNLWN